MRIFNFLILASSVCLFSCKKENEEPPQGTQLSTSVSKVIHSSLGYGTSTFTPYYSASGQMDSIKIQSMQVANPLYGDDGDEVIKYRYNGGKLSIKENSKTTEYFYYNNDQISRYKLEANSPTFYTYPCDYSFYYNSNEELYYLKNSLNDSIAVYNNSPTNRKTKVFLGGLPTTCSRELSFNINPDKSFSNTRGDFHGCDVITSQGNFSNVKVNIDPELWYILNTAPTGNAFSNYPYIDYTNFMYAIPNLIFKDIIGANCILEWGEYINNIEVDQYGRIQEISTYRGSDVVRKITFYY